MTKINFQQENLNSMQELENLKKKICQIFLFNFLKFETCEKYINV